MKFNTSFAALAVAALTLAPKFAFAHFIWGTITPDNRVRFALLEDPSETPKAAFASYVEKLAVRCGKSVVTLGEPKDGARSGALPAGANVASSDTIVGVKSRDGVDYLLGYHAKATTSLAAAKAVSGSPAEVLAWRDGDFLVVRVLQDGWPSPAAEVTVHWPADVATITTDLKGEARVPWANAATAGFVGVRAKVIDATPGTQDGKSFTQIHHWATLTFPLAASK